MRKPIITKYCRIDEPRDGELERKFEQFIEDKVDKFLKHMMENPSKVTIIKDK